MLFTMRQTIYLLATSLALVLAAPIPQILGTPGWYPNGGVPYLGGLGGVGGGGLGGLGGLGNPGGNGWNPFGTGGSGGLGGGIGGLGGLGCSWPFCDAPRAAK